MRNCPQLWLPAVGLSLLAFGFSAVGVVFAQGIEAPPAPLPTLDSVIDDSATVQVPAPAPAPAPAPVVEAPAPVVEAPAVIAPAPVVEAPAIAAPAPVVVPAGDIAAPIPVESSVTQAAPEPVTLPEPIQMPMTAAPAPAPAQVQQYPVQQAPVASAPVQVQQYPVQQAPAAVAPVQVQQGPVYYQQPFMGGLLPPLRVYRAGEFSGTPAPAYGGPMHGGSMYSGRPGMGMAPRRGAQIDSGPYYTTRGPRDFYLQNPRPLGP